MNDVYLGIDCGSVGIKSVLLREDDSVLSSSYLRNSGLIETVKKCLSEIRTDKYEVKGVGVTGSGRKFVGSLVGADEVRTEVLAHTIATIHHYNNVQTNLDLGGEDGKIMIIRDGVLTSFYMNEVCGAGCGAIIDTIASRLGIPIEQVGDIALQSKERLNFPGKCGVFLQSSVVSRLNNGAKKEDILMGVIRALVHNYLLLCADGEILPPYVFTGMTSKNKAIVSALEEKLKSEVIVPEHSHLMGAIGMGILARRNKKEYSNFKGFEISDKEYTTKIKLARGCSNNCEITMLYEENKYLGCLGNRCEKCVPKGGENA